MSEYEIYTSDWFIDRLNAYWLDTEVGERARALGLTIRDMPDTVIVVINKNSELYNYGIYQVDLHNEPEIINIGDKEVKLVKQSVCYCDCSILSLSNYGLLLGLVNQQRFRLKIVSDSRLDKCPLISHLAHAKTCEYLVNMSTRRFECPTHLYFSGYDNLYSSVKSNVQLECMVASYFLDLFRTDLDTIRKYIELLVRLGNKPFSGHYSQYSSRFIIKIFGIQGYEEYVYEKLRVIDACLYDYIKLYGVDNLPIYGIRLEISHIDCIDDSGMISKIKSCNFKDKELLNNFNKLGTTDLSIEVYDI